MDEADEDVDASALDDEVALAAFGSDREPGRDRLRHVQLDALGACRGRAAAARNDVAIVRAEPRAPLIVRRGRALGVSHRDEPRAAREARASSRTRPSSRRCSV